MIERFGTYQVVRELGRGGMGVVYQAVAPSGESVAIKVLLDLVADAELHQRFEIEIRACAGLDHPNVVRMLGAGRAPRPHLILELLEGETLQERIARDGPLPVRAAVEVVAELARGLQSVHARGILHRDLKPSNIFLCPDRPVITDFGLARDPVQERERLTATGQMLGTPAYMAPEQANGEKEGVGPWSDVYGLGAVLYYALTGKAPFAGGMLQVFQQVLEVTPQAPSRWRAEVDAALDGITLRCLEKQAQERFSSAAALGAALEDYLLTEQVRRRESTRAPRVAIAAGLVVLGLVGLGSVLALRSAPTESARASPRPTPAERRVSTAAPSPTSTPTADPASTPTATSAAAHASALGEARRAFDEHEREGALRALERAPRSSWSADAWVLFARVRYVQARISLNEAHGAEARRALQRAVELDRKHLEAWQRIVLIGTASERSPALAAARRLHGSQAPTALQQVVEAFDGLIQLRAATDSKKQWLRLAKRSLDGINAAFELEPESRDAGVVGFTILNSMASKIPTFMSLAGFMSVFRSAVSQLEERSLQRDPLVVALAGYAIKEAGGRARSVRLREMAIRHFDDAIALEPNHAHAYLERGYTKSRLGRSGEAVQDLEQACKLAPHSGHALFTLAVVLEASGRPAAALRRLSQAIRVASESQVARYRWKRGDLRLNLGDPSGAAADYALARPHLSPAGRAKVEAARQRAAVEARVVSLASEDVEARRWREALDQLGRAGPRARGSSFLLLYARALLDRDRYLTRPEDRARGLQILRRLVERLPDSLEPRVRLALIEPRRAVPAEELEASAGSPALAALGWVGRARALVYGRPSGLTRHAAEVKALRLVRRALELDPGCVPATEDELGLLAEMCADPTRGADARAPLTQQLERRVASLLRAPTTSPLVLVAAARRILQLSDRQGGDRAEANRRRADQAVAAALSLEERLPKALVLRGGMRMQAGRKADAVRDLTQASRYDPGLKIAVLWSVGLYLDLNQTAKAEEWATRAVERWPEPRTFHLRARVYDARGKIQQAAADRAEAAKREGKKTR